MKRAWTAWVALLDRREPATSIALVRILVGVVIAFDLVEVARLGLVEALYAPADTGTLGFLPADRDLPLAYDLLGPIARTAWLLFGVGLAASVSLAAGLFARTSALVLAFTGAQLGAAMPAGDRGIDVALRVVLLLLAFAPSGRTLAVDAYLRTGRFVDEAPAPAWPRYLLVAQLVWIYFSAGVNKAQLLWYPPGGCIALHHVLHDPHFARFDPEWLVAARPLTQVATFATMLFELGAPLVLVAIALENRATAPGRIGRAIVGLRLRVWFLVVGAAFHAGIAVTMRLGIFPYGMLALYPALVPPDRWARARELVALARARLRPASSAPTR